MSVIDEAFMPFQQIVSRLLAFSGEVSDTSAGVRSRIVRCEIESPIELDIVRDEDHHLHIGSAPPLYYVDTSFRPSYHKLRLTAVVTEDRDGE